MMLAFSINYLYELPEDIQAIIYKKVYQFSLDTIRDSKEANNNFNKLKLSILRILLVLKRFQSKFYM
jgi:hypothetical protein